jgi:putative transcriptional regulator
MQTHADDYLPEHALGLLEGNTRTEVEEHLAQCERCAARLLELGGALEPSATSCSAPKAVQVVETAPIRLRLARVEHRARFQEFVDRVAELFDMRASKAQALLELIDDDSCWLPGPAEGIRVFPVSGGPRLSAAAAMIVRGAPGAVFPHHVHVGEEHLLVLQGRLRDDGGIEGGRGDRLEMPAGSAHSVEVLAGEECLCCVVNEAAEPEPAD